MDEKSSTTNALPTDNVQYIVDTLGVIFSTIVISGINVIVSGHLLGYVFGLLKEEVADEKKTWFEIWFPWVLRLGITGRCVYAGFASFAVFILIVGFVFSDTAKSIFIENLSATDNKWTACQSLAAGFSVVSCLILASIRRLIDFYLDYRYERFTASPSRDERVRRLIEDSTNKLEKNE